MRSILLVIMTFLLTGLGFVYMLQSNTMPEFFSLLIPTNYSTTPTGTEGAAIAPTGMPCTTPRGSTVQHGEVFLSFQDPSASLADGGCVSRSTVCNNGSWAVEQEPFDHEICDLETPAYCEANGYIITHGTTETLYAFDEESGICTTQERTCTDGALDGDERYVYISCPSSCANAIIEGNDETGCPACPCLEEDTEEPEEEPTTPTPSRSSSSSSAPLLRTSNEPNCPAPFGGRRREPGQEGKAYRSATVPNGQVCEQISLVCAFGSIRIGTKDAPGDVAPSTLATSCEILPPANCESACGPIAHGDQVTTYKQSIIPHGNGQTCTDIQVVSTCTNGTLSPVAGTSCSCQIAPPAACNAPNGKTVPHGSSLTLYEYPQVQALPGDGADVCLRQWRTCFNGVFQDWNGNPSPFTFKYETCTVIAPPEGGGPGGDGIPVTQ